MTEQPQSHTPQVQKQPELPPLTAGQKIRYSLIALILVGAIGGLIAWSVTSSNKESARVNDIKENGIRVTGTANGEVYEYTDRSKRGGTSIRYKAIYTYAEQGQTIEDPEDAYTAIGEKLYDSKEEVEALKGKTANVYYDEKGGTFVEDEK